MHTSELPDLEASVSSPEPADRSRWIALVVLCLGMLMIVLDVTIVNVALPSIQAELGFSQSGLAWVVNAYLIAFGGLLLLAGRLGDLAGRRKVFLTGLGVFTAASMVCGLAVDQPMLIGARFVQGIGGALTSAVILGVIVTLFPEPRDMAKAIGVYAFVASAGGAAGLLAGGILTQAINWHWIFFVNLPIGIVTAALALRVIPRDRGNGLRGGADVAGAVLITGAMMLGVFTIVKPAASDGWLARQTLTFGAISLLLLAGFIVRQMTARNPLMPLRILAARQVAGANLIQVLSVAGMFGMFFLGSLYLRLVLGYSPMQIGLAFLPVTIAMGTLSVRYTDRLAARFGPRTTMIAGLVAIVLALVLFTQAPIHGGYARYVFPVMLLMGTGAGLAFPALMTVAMADATPADAGLASGLVNTTAQVGGALGLAVLATVSAGRTSALTARGTGTLASLNGGYHLAFWIAAGLAAAAIAVAAVVLRPNGPAPQEGLSCGVMEEWPGSRDDLAPDVIGTGGEFGLLDRWPWIRRARIIAFPVLAAAVIAVAVTVLPGSHRVPASHGAPRAAARQPPRVTISSEMPGRVGPGGVFATGRADGQPWRLAVQNIAGSGARCQPAVTVNGADADPLFPGPPRLTPVGNPAFMTLGDSVPGVGFAFIQVPAQADWVWLEPKPIDGLMLGMTPATISACGKRFRLVGFAYPTAGTLRIHESPLPSGGSYTVPAELSDPRPTLADPQVAGVWQNPDGAHARAASATLASGTAYGQRWSIRLDFGTAGDCFTLDTSYIDDSANAKPSQTSYCGPISTPQGPDTIMALALGSPASIGPGPPSSAGLGVGYAVSVGPGTARLTAQLSDGSVMEVTPVVVGGRKYAAFFIPGPRVLTWLNWVNAVGQDIAGVQDLPGNGYTQFQP